MSRNRRAAPVMAMLALLAGCMGSGPDTSGLAPLTSDLRLAPEGPANTAPPPDTVGPSTPPASAAPAAASAPSPAAIATNARIQFAPVVGADAARIAPLAGLLAARAAQRGIGVAAPGDASATHILKGYFSAITGDGQTTVVYVWDVLDGAGTRLHRIQGQEKAAGPGAGWDAVIPTTVEAIANRTIDELASWLSSRPA